MEWREKERSRIKVVQMDSLGGLLDIKRIGKLPSTWVKEICEMTRGGR